MILRNKILIGVASTAAVVGVATDIAIQAGRDDNHAPVFHNSFITSINAANEFMQLNVREKKDDGTFKEGSQTAFGTPMTSFNSKTKNLSINFDQIFSAQSKEEYKEQPDDSIAEKARKEKLRLFFIGKGVGVTGVYIRYNQSGVVSRMNTYNVDVPTEYATDKIDAFDYNHPDPSQSDLVANSKYETQLKSMLKVPNGYMEPTFQARDTLYDIDGMVRYQIPSMNKDGTVAQKYNLSNDEAHPVLIDPFDGHLTSIDEVSASDIKDAIITQLTKLAYFADKEMQTISFTSASYEDDIKDSTIESFQLDPTNDRKGIFTSVRGQSVELLKMLLKLENFKSSCKVITPLKKERYDKLTVAEKQFFHMYDADGNPIGVDVAVLGDDPYAKKPTADSDYIGITVKNEDVNKPNLLSIANEDVTTFAAKLELIDKKFYQEYLTSIKNHKSDQDLFIRRNEYKPKAPKFNWFQSSESKHLPSDGESMYNYQHNVPADQKYIDYSNYGFTSTANNGISSPMEGISVGEVFNMFYQNNSNPSTSKVDLLRKIDRNSLYEVDADAAGGYAPHSQVSIKHPFVMGINDIELTTFDFMKNYRTSINTEAQKIYSKDEVKKDIFGSNSATDTDMYEFLYLTADMFENDLKTPSNTNLMVDGRYTIGTGMQDDDLKALISGLNLTTGSYEINNGFIIFKGYGTDGSKLVSGTHDIEKVYDALFAKDSWTVNNLGKQPLKDSKDKDGKDVSVEDGPVTYKTNTLNNSMKADSKLLSTAEKDAQALLISNDFRSSFVAQTNAKASLQTFSASSRTKQDILNSIFYDVFQKDGAQVYDKFGTSDRGKLIIHTPVDSTDPTKGMKDDMLKDYYFAGLDARGSALNVAYENSQIKATMSNGLPLSFNIFSNLVLSLSSQVKGSGALYLFDSFEKMIQYPDTFKGKMFMSGAPDDQFDQFAAFIYMLDKVGIQVKFQITDANPDVETLFETMFGKENISQYDSYALGQDGSKVHIIELKQNKYKDALETYIDYVYADQIAVSQKAAIETYAKEVDAAYTKATTKS